MAIKYVRADITTLKVDAIVNSANPLPIIGGGVDSAIYKAAGAERLLAERKKIGAIDVGDARVTSGFDLCRVIIHTVGPRWIDGQHNELENLRNCYRISLALALREQCRSIAFPLISTGVYGFPKDEALNIATSEINEFLMKHGNVKVIICIFDEDSFMLSGKIAENVEEFISRQKATEKLQEEYGSRYETVMERSKKSKLIKVHKRVGTSYRYELPNDVSTFADKLYYYVDLLDEKPSAIYDRAWLPRRTYSRIMCGNYSPRKDAAIALCLALKLNVQQTMDLLSRNSMAFNPSDKSDQFILICIKNKTYDLEKINEGLVKLGLFDKTFIDRRDI
ncbi:MAG: macro domain-containing protein [Erysipelotrichaceae bacterium]|nr:macro domain-containing protein [Erysipelotrichaceae bacterium]